MITIKTPLEQFIIFNIFSFENIMNINKILFTESIFHNLALNFLLVFILIILINLILNYFYYNLINKELIYNDLIKFLKDLFLENVSLKKPYFFSIVIYIFTIILLSNTLGLIPFCFTNTSSIIVTFFISLSSFINIIFTGLKLHGLKFFNLFLPSGAPFNITPLLIIIEFISFNARIFSLAIRLFANMMSGHILLKIFSIAIFKLFIVYFPLSILYLIIPNILVLIIIVLEFCIAFLQAYVFITLLCIYFNEAINLH